jgi:hypothetical protein
MKNLPREKNFSLGTEKLFFLRRKPNIFGGFGINA